MSPPARLDVRADVPLAPRTSLALGGAARFLVEVTEEPAVADALAWAQARGLRVHVLGGGTNVVVADAGVDALVVDVRLRGVTRARDGASVVVTAAAGEEWDTLVADTVADGLAGLECLSGIPGRVGATPIQNVGAYGVEVAERIASVRVLDRGTGRVHALGPEDCGFAYRDSRFRRAPEGHVVLSVSFRLTPGGAATVRYPELARALGGRAGAPPGEVREVVRALRAAKSMLLGVPGDPNARSAGSFFLNPIVASEAAERLAARAAVDGLAPTADAVPRWPLPDGRTKLAAAWLIERAGFPRGTRRGPVGTSTAHALALVHHGGGTTAALLALADEIADGVRRRFGVTLEREPALFR